MWMCHNWFPCGNLPFSIVKRFSQRRWSWAKRIRISATMCHVQFRVQWTEIMKNRSEEYWHIPGLHRDVIFLFAKYFAVRLMEFDEGKHEDNVLTKYLMASELRSNVKIQVYKIKTCHFIWIFQLLKCYFLTFYLLLLFCLFCFYIIVKHFIVKYLGTWLHERFYI